MSARLLFVDDDAATLEALTGYFRLCGYEVATAADQAAAERLLDAGGFECVVADLSLAARDPRGLELLRRARLGRRRTPFIVLSGHAAGEAEESALRDGASAYVEKPVGLARLEALVQRLVAEPSRR